MRKAGVESAGAVTRDPAHVRQVRSAVLDALVALGLATQPRLLRLCFLGRSEDVARTLGASSDWVETSFVDFSSRDDFGQIVSDLRDRKPDVVIVLAPELVPRGAFQELPAITVGYLSEPVSRGDGPSHTDLSRHRSDLRMLDPGNFDRLISFDPLMVSTVEAIAPVWRSVPFPVSDRYYRDPHFTSGRPRVVFLGNSTPHRESFLLGPKQRFGIVHITSDPGPDDLEGIADDYDVGIGLHPEANPTFENQVCFHLAAGHLVLTEPLSPTHGLEPGIDFIEVSTPERLQWELALLHEVPDRYRRVRIRGRQKAELFRASRVYPALVVDLLRDLEAFGSERLR